MPPLHRHQLAHLSAAGWREVLERDWDDELRACLALWAERSFPLVVTRQRVPRHAEDAPVSLGLAAPLQWGRRLLALELPPSRIAWFGEFPCLAEALQQLPRRARPGVAALGQALAGLGVSARAYGSVAWQHVTGMRYVHRRSDFDVWLAVEGPEQADAAARAMLQHLPAGAPRLDGELLFLDGSAVAWREWLAWRAGSCRSLLVKRLDGVAIEQAPGLPAPAAAGALA